MRLPRAGTNLKLLIALVVGFAGYLVWRVGSETTLERTLRRGETRARRAAVVSLGDQLIQVGASVIPPLASALVRDPDAEVRFLAATALGNSAMPDEAAAAALIHALKRDQPRIRARAAQSLATMASWPRVTPALIAALADPSAEVRAEAAASLARGFQDGEEVELALFAARADPHSAVRAAIIAAMDLRSSQPSSKTPSGSGRAGHYQAMMLAGLKDESPLVRRAAARALGHEPSFGFDDKVTLTEGEIAAISDPDAEVSAAAARALGAHRDYTRNVGRRTPTTEPERRASARALARLVVALGDADDRVRNAAADALGSVGSDMGKPSAEEAKSLRLELVTLLDGPRPEARAVAIAHAGYLEYLAGNDGEFLDRRYAIAVRDPDPRVRLAAFVAWTYELTRCQGLRQNAKFAPNYLVTLLARATRWTPGILLEIPYARMVVKDYLTVRLGLDRGRIEQFDKLLRPRLDDSDPDVRRVAYAGLWRVDSLLGGDDADRRRALLCAMKSQMEALGSDSPRLREIAAWSLGWVPEADAPAAMLALKLRAADADSRVRGRVAASLKQHRDYQDIRPRHPWPEPRWEPWERR